MPALDDLQPGAFRDVGVVVDGGAVLGLLVLREVAIRDEAVVELVGIAAFLRLRPAVAEVPVHPAVVLGFPEEVGVEAQDGVRLSPLPGRGVGTEELQPDEGEYGGDAAGGGAVRCLVEE